MFLNLATLESEMPSVASSLRAMKIQIEARSTSKYAATGGAPAALRKYECASRLRPLDPRVEKQRQLCRRQSYGLRNKTEVLRLLDALRERIAEFGLSLNEEKTRILKFGRYAAERLSRRGNAARRRSTSSGSRTSARCTQRNPHFTIRRVTLDSRNARMARYDTA